MEKDNIISFDQKKQEFLEKKFQQEMESINQYDFIKGELFVVNNLILAVEFARNNKSFSSKNLLNSLYLAKKDLEKALENNKVPDPIS